MTKPKSKFLLEFSNNLRNARKDAGLTQKQLADMLFVSPNSICMYERGQRAPNLEMILVIAKVIGVDVVDLFPEPDMSFMEDERQMTIGDLL